jgi:hypothetical protein
VIFSVRISLFLCCVFFMLPANADWTGIGAFLVQGKSDWQLGDNIMRNDFTQYGLRIEEKTEVELRLGASAGQFDLKFLDDNGVLPFESYDGQFVSFYMRWPHQLTDTIRLHSLFNYQYNLGKQSDNQDNEINWTEVTLDLGISYQLGRLSIRPFVDYRYVDGDITGSGAARLLKLDSPQSTGLNLDYFIERDAFLRLRFSRGSYRSFMLSVAREF